jgi:hypothetical protein
LMRTICGFAVLSLSLLAFTVVARAQNGSVYFAGGTATAPSAGQVNTLGDGTLYQAPTMGGFFGTVGGDFLFFHSDKIGVGAEYSFRKDEGPYAGLLYRPRFFDVNAVYQPFTFAHRFTPEFQLGAGKAMLATYYTLESCYKLPQGCAGPNAEVTSVSPIQAHFSAGLRVYVYKGIFVRPQFDLRWVQNDFSYYFGSSWVKQYSFAVGYTIRSFHFPFPKK